MKFRQSLVLLIILLASSAAAPLAAQSVNGCDLSAPTVTNWLDVPPAMREITFVCCEYTPRCSKIDAGQSVTFSGNFSSHPLRGGLIVMGVPQPQPGNPIPDVSSGTTPVEVTFPDPGAWGYYCDFHQPAMAGAVLVAVFADGFEAGDTSEWSGTVPLGFPLDD